MSCTASVSLHLCTSHLPVVHGTCILHLSSLCLALHLSSLHLHLCDSSSCQLGCLAPCLTWAVHGTAFHACVVWSRLGWCCILGMLLIRITHCNVRQGASWVWVVVGMLLVNACAKDRLSWDAGSLCINQLCNTQCKLTGSHKHPIGLLNVRCFAPWFCYNHAILMFLFWVFGSMQSMYIVCYHESHVNNFSTLVLFAFQKHCCRSRVAHTPQELQTNKIKRWLHTKIVVTPVLIGSLYR